MIYLIGGSPRTGKTILAKKLSQELNIPWVSADDLEQEYKQTVPAENRAELFPKDAIREQTQSSNDIMYTKHSAEEIRDAYIIQSKATWPSVAKLVNDKIDQQESLIIEGHQIHPELMDQLILQHGTENIKAIVLLKTGVENIVETARSNQDENDWFLKKTTDPEVHYKIAEMLQKYSEYFASEAKKYNIDVIEYGGNFDQQITKAIKILQ